MAFASIDSGDENEPLAEINMVPLIDVMLVLLIIFMVTAPLLTHAVKVNLPKATSSANLTKPDNIQLAVNAGGQIFWNGETVSAEQFTERLTIAGSTESPPELHLRAERTTPYETLARIMSESTQHGITRIGFVTDPSMITPHSEVAAR